MEYRHVYSSTGGAQYGVGPASGQDLLVVFAEAFERDADPDDFSLEAILAHERGHQILYRNPRLQALYAGSASDATEEMMASLVASLIAEKQEDSDALVFKALNEVVRCGIQPKDASRLVSELQSLLEKML